jgi:hypothetical protein
LSTTALVSIPVGVVVERHKATSPWIDYLWRPSSVLEGIPSAAPWTALGAAGDVTTFYAGTATVELYRTETANYLSNLDSGTPLLWVALRPTGTDTALEVIAVTADPAEGEALTEAGQDIVETLPMPSVIVQAVGAFIVEHHVERPFFKRRRDDANEGMGRFRGPRRE